MKKIFLLAMTVALLGFTDVASAGFLSYFDTSGQSLTKVKFTNYEILLRQNDSTGQIVIGSHQFDPVAPGSVAVGDFAVQILQASSIAWETSPEQTKWSYVANGPEMTAYAVQEVLTNVATGSLDSDRTTSLFEQTYKVARLDPFGIVNVTNNEISHIYFDETPGIVFTSAGTLQQGVNSATDGTLFAAFGFGAAVDAGRGGAPGANAALKSEELELPPVLLDVSLKGGLNIRTNIPFLTFLPVLNKASYLPVSTSIESGIAVNPHFATEPWPLKSEDPWRFRVTPEPASTVALLGLGLMGLFGVAYRRWRWRV